MYILIKEQAGLYTKLGRRGRWHGGEIERMQLSMESNDYSTILHCFTGI